MNQGSYDLRRDVDRLKNKTDELAKDYFLQVDVPIVSYQNETYTPSYVSATSYASNHDLTGFYDGYIVLWSSTDGFNEDKTYVSYTHGHTLTHTIEYTNITNYLFELYDENWSFLDKQTVTIVRTTKGGTGKGYDFIYYTTAKTSLTQADYPINGQDYTTLTGNSFDVWYQRPKDVDASHPNIFMSLRTTDDNEEWGDWSTPVKYSGIGERGEDGEGLEMIFCRTEYIDDYPLDPSTLDPVQTEDYVPTGWSDDQQGVNSTYCFEYVCMRTKEVPTGGKVAQWGKFSSPKLWASYGQDGADGKGIEFIFRRNNNPNSPPSFRGTGDQRQDKKTFTGTVNNKHFSDDDYVPQDWTDDQQGVDENNQVEWVCKRVKKVTNGVASWDSFNTPQVWANWSEDGDDPINIMLGNEAQLIPVNADGGLKGGEFTINIPVYCYKGLSRVAGTININSIVTSGSSSPFSNKTFSNPTVSNDGSVTLTVSRVPSVVTHNEAINVTVEGKTYTKYFTWNKIGDGADGNDGGTYDFVYYTTADPPNNAPTINPSTTIQNNPNRVLMNTWCARPTNPTEQYPYCYGAYIKKVDGTINGDYSDVYLWSKYGKDGTNGSPGSTHDYAYYTSSNSTFPSAPTGNVTATSGTEKWTTVPVSMTSTKQYMYITYRVNGGTWSSPSLWAKYGQNGQNGQDGARGKDGLGLEHIFYLADDLIGWETFTDTGVTGSSASYGTLRITKTVSSTGTTITPTTSDSSGHLFFGSSSKRFPVGFTIEFDLDSVNNDCRIAIWDDVSATQRYIYLDNTGHYILHITDEMNGTCGGNEVRKSTGYPIAPARISFMVNGTGSSLRFKNLQLYPYTNPSNPSEWSAQQTDDYVLANSGWTDDATGVSEAHQYEYCAIRKKSIGSDGKTAVWGKFDTPTLWAKFSLKGGDGEDGADGKGLEMVFRRTNNATAPSFVGSGNQRQDKKTFTGTVNNKHFSDDDYVPQNWTDNPLGVDSANIYEWVAMRLKTIKDNGEGEWQNFSTPSVWAKYSPQGLQGKQGPQGEPGRNGDELTGDEIMTRISGQYINAQAVGDILPNEIITTKLADTGLIYDNNNHGYYRIYKMGRLVIFFIADYQVNITTTGSNVTVFTLPEWARPDVSDWIIITTAPSSYSNSSYPNYKYSLNFSSISESILSSLEVGDVFEYNGYLYPVVNINTTSQKIYMGARRERGVAKLYFPNIPTSESLSITEDGLFRILPTSTGATRQISSTISYIATEGTRYAVTFNVITTSTIVNNKLRVSLVSGNELIISPMGNSTSIKNVPVTFFINNSYYTKNTKATGQANLTINLPAGTYTDCKVEFGGNATYQPKTETFDLVVTAQTGDVSITQKNSHAALIKVGGNPIPNLSCKINIEGQIFYHTTDYNGILEMSSILSNFIQGTHRATIYTNDTGRCKSASQGMDLTGTKQVARYTKTLTPSSIANNSGINQSDYSEKGGTYWNYATTGALAHGGDGAYAITDILSYGATAGILRVGFSPQLPTGAVVKKVELHVCYASLKGWDEDSFGSYTAGVSKIKVFKNSSDTTLNGLTQKDFITPTISYGDNNTWYDVGYQWTGLSIADTDFTNPFVRIEGITNEGGGYQCSSRFGIDYVQMIVEYEV